jgi:RND family efflux transporter MFP subunit
MKRALTIVSILVITSLATFKLMSNKKRVEEETRIASEVCDTYPVKISVAERNNTEMVIEATGRMESDSELSLKSEINGSIIKVLAEEGDYVTKGQTIVKIDKEVFNAKKQYAEANYKQCLADYNRYKNLAEKDAVTGQNLEQAKLKLDKAESDLIKLKRDLRNTDVVAPISGTVDKMHVEVGTLVGNSAMIADIVDNRVLNVEFKLDEKEILNVKRGQQATVMVSAYPNKKFSGKIKSVGVKADKTHKYRVILAIDNRENMLRAGMFAEVNINVGAKSIIKIPRNAIVGSLKEAKVFVINNNKAELRDVVTGDTFKKSVEIISGLNEGDKVVIGGKINLENGTSVSILNKRMNN